MERPRLVVNFGGKGELYLKLVFLQNFSVIKAKITGFWPLLQANTSFGF